MWTHEASIDCDASPGALWPWFTDVAGWPRWNAGVVSATLHGPFARGTRFTMHPAGGEPLAMTLTEVTDELCFTDETVVDGNRVAVAHLLLPRRDGGTRIVYRTQVDGPDDSAVGRLVCADFDDVLGSLKRLAERELFSAVS